MLGLAVAGTGNFELRGVSGKEDRQDMVESVVRSEREDRQDVVYADSDGGANVDDAIESGRRKLGDSSATEAWLDEECTVPSSSISSSTVENQLPPDSLGSTKDLSMADNVMLLDRPVFVPAVDGSNSFS